AVEADDTRVGVVPAVGQATVRVGRDVGSTLRQDRHPDGRAESYESQKLSHLFPHGKTWPARLLALLKTTRAHPGRTVSKPGVTDTTLICCCPVPGGRSRGSAFVMR